MVGMPSLNAIKLRNIVGWATCFCCPPVGVVGKKNTLPTLVVSGMERKRISRYEVSEAKPSTEFREIRSAPLRSAPLHSRNN